MKTIIPNQNSDLYTVLSCEELKSIDDLVFLPVLAWEIESFVSAPGAPEDYMSIPITLEGRDENGAIINITTRHWWSPMDQYGQSDDSLMVYLRERQPNDRT